MKRILAIFLACALLMTMALAGCGAKTEGNPPAGTAPGATPTEQTPAEEPSVAPAVTDDPGVKALNVWSFTVEVPDMLDKYKALHPDFPYEIKPTVIATTDGAYEAGH